MSSLEPGQYPCPGGCHAVLDSRDTHSCWRCGFVLSIPEPQAKPVLPDSATGDRFVYLGYDIEWEDYRPGFAMNEVRAEWVARSHNGVAAIRMPAIVSAGAGVAARTAEKLRVLRKLIALLDGAE